MRRIKKGGGLNVKTINLERWKRFTFDFLTTILDKNWWYVIFMLLGSTFLCWYIFALLWYLVAKSHGDLEFSATGERLDTGEQECIHDCENMVEFMLMSIEVQTTLGFGHKHPTENCPVAIFLFAAQTFIGSMFNGAVVAIFYSKLICPKKHCGLRFSRKAVICRRDGVLCFVFRVWDKGLRHLAKNRVKVSLFREQWSIEGERLTHMAKPMKIQNRGRLFGMWPLTVCHEIDNGSPLKNVQSLAKLQLMKFEIVVTYTGDSSVTAQKSQMRTSYTSREILWDHRFTNIVHFNDELGQYFVDEASFDEVELNA